MLLSAKLAPTFDYPVLEEFWRNTDELGFHSVANYDHFYGLGEPATPTFEGWTTLAAMGSVVRRARISCLVSGVTYRHPAVLAKMAVTVDHISGGRLDFGIGAGWHEREHRGYGIEFPSAGTRVAMLDEALTVIRRLWTEESVTFTGQFYTLTEALCEPKPVQRPHPPIVIGGDKPRMLRVIARHADEWNATSIGDVQVWAETSARLDTACRDAGRDPAQIRRSVQLFLYPTQEGQIDEQLARLPEFEAAGCAHAVLSFYQPPTVAQLQRIAELA
ncbi:TIGR03560 family F420-dependent LLM class oxidoreductase [Mycolicibacterium komossense]|uniref:TIGR03560 family F420-dependent LLM class oxidoreductase n=1 Tax=Mycolicibacterium komossense TaxID=1779 RepID=A0ABT3CHD4_9MYCO|nr:TIGR03560 family F420-dependent LLM class oxidoreductase [Mycolicibacterium komossense]MCV7228859.1 TIGR03560 family F420-dependent LLM class oxidoreductase [Mycolicibacterium komossense]